MDSLSDDLSSFRFPKEARVRKRKDYLKFFNRSETKRLGPCLIFKIPNVETQPRLGITVKARVNSVERNRIKRQIRESFRLHRHRLLAFDYNVVVPGQVQVNDQTAKQIRKNLDSIWSHEIVF